MAEQVFCVVGGLCLIVAGVALARLRAPEWYSRDSSEQRQHQADYISKLQRVLRWWNNRLIAAIGGLIVCTAAIPHGKHWMLAWSTIFVLLLLVILLAILDAFSSIIAYRRSLTTTLRSTLQDDSKQC